MQASIQYYGSFWYRKTFEIGIDGKSELLAPSTYNNLPIYPNLLGGWFHHRKIHPRSSHFWYIDAWLYLPLYPL